MKVLHIKSHVTLCCFGLLNTVFVPYFIGVILPKNARNVGFGKRYKVGAGGMIRSSNLLNTI